MRGCEELFIGVRKQKGGLKTVEGAFLEEVFWG